MEAMSWATLAFALFSILIVRTIRRRLHKGRTLPPGPRPLPIVGNLHQLLNGMPHRCLARLAEKYGPIMTLRLGQTTTLVISSPDMAREVLQKNDLAFSGRAIPDAIRALRYGDLSVAWIPANPEWRNLRMIYNTELFSSKRLDSTKGLREQKVRELISYVSECCVSRKALNIGQLVSVTILNMISSTIFSVDLADLRSESSPEVIELVHNIMKGTSEPNLADFFPWLKVLDPLGLRRRVTKSMKKLHDIFDELVDRRLRGEDATPHDDFLDRLPHGGKMDCLHDRFIRNAFFTIFIAGTETSSNTVEWAMAELLRNPGMMAKAKEEIDRVIEPGKDQVEESDIEKLHYLQAVIKESFRLHPTAAFLLPRRAERTVDVGDQYVVPEGTRVVVNNWAIGRDKRDIDVRGREFEFLPFGSGRRICAGLPLAVRMVPLMLASLLRGFDWQPPDGMAPEDIDMRETQGIPVAMAVPLRAVPLAA
ncbi:putative geraniol 8-hydroxylase [Dioscorea sansibarensis]